MVICASNCYSAVLERDFMRDAMTLNQPSCNAPIYYAITGSRVCTIGYVTTFRMLSSLAQTCDYGLKSQISSIWASNHCLPPLGGSSEN